MCGRALATSVDDTTPMVTRFDVAIEKKSNNPKCDRRRRAPDPVLKPPPAPPLPAPSPTWPESPPGSACTSCRVMCTPVCQACDVA